MEYPYESEFPLNNEGAKVRGGAGGCGLKGTSEPIVEPMVDPIPEPIPPGRSEPNVDPIVEPIVEPIPPGREGPTGGAGGRTPMGGDGGPIRHHQWHNYCHY